MHIMAVEKAQCGLLPVTLQPELTEQGFSETSVKYHREETERKKSSWPWWSNTDQNRPMGRVRPRLIHNNGAATLFIQTIQVHSSRAIDIKVDPNHILNRHNRYFLNISFKPYQCYGLLKKREQKSLLIEKAKIKYKYYMKLNCKYDFNM